MSRVLLGGCPRRRETAAKTKTPFSRLQRIKDKRVRVKYNK
jgi:hypothetical protein